MKWVCVFTSILAWAEFAALGDTLFAVWGSVFAMFAFSEERLAKREKQ